MRSNVPAPFSVLFTQLFIALVLFLQPVISNATPPASTYLGGDQSEGGWPRISMEVDANGDVFVAGFTLSTDFPTTEGAYDRTFRGNSAVFIAKFNADFSELLASTLFGGNSYDFCYSMTLDDEGNVYVTGHSPSTDLPTTTGVLYGTYQGTGGYDQGDDVFVAKFSNDLSTLIACTYLGGAQWEMATDIKVSSEGLVALTGYTDDTSFPTTDTAFNGTLPGNRGVFASVLSNDFTTLVGSSFLSVHAIDDRPQLAFADNGNVYVTGVTMSSSLPVTEGCFKSTLSGYGSGYVMALDETLSSMIACTYLGGSDFDFLYDLEFDSQGDLFVVGHTVSSDIPGTTNGFQSTHSGVPDGFVCRMSSDLTTVHCGSYVGGSSNDNVMGITIGPDDVVYLSGYTSSSNFIVTDGALDTDFNGSDDAFILSCNRDLSILNAATYFGGSGTEHGNTIRLGGSGQIYCAGPTSSSNLPFTDGAYDATYAGGAVDIWSGDVYLMSVDASLSGDNTSVRPVVPSHSQLYNLRISPNPFNEQTVISFSLDQPARVNMHIYDVSGRLVTTLVESVQLAGRHKYSWNAEGIPSGVYFCEFQTPFGTQTRRIVLVR